jgi:hypothetical protein
MEDSTTEDTKNVFGESRDTNTDVFLLKYYGSTTSFRYGSSQGAVLNYIKEHKGGRGGCFNLVAKDGQHEPFLGEIFEKEENIIGYEFVPEELASPYLGEL